MKIIIDPLVIALLLADSPLIRHSFRDTSQTIFDADNASNEQVMEDLDYSIPSKTTFH